MSRLPSIWPSALSHLKTVQPDHPVLYFAPDVLIATARAFQAGFPGQVTYAVKANDGRAVIENLMAAGITAFDVASPAEIAALRAISPDVALHYNNPVRSPAEVAAGVAAGVASWSVDGLGEFAKLAAQVPRGAEIAVRLHLPVAGAAYDFGAKFGEGPDAAVPLLRTVADAGYRPAMCFHPGTQCNDPAAWRAYIVACADVAGRAGVRLDRLNVGGGFAAHRGRSPDWDAIFAEIRAATDTAFGSAAPDLICEPGRALVAESFTLATRVKAIREDGAVFLNDGIYGALGEAMTALGVVDRLSTLRPDGTAHADAPVPRVVFGPTCDSLDRLPGELMLPADLAEGDYVLMEGMGAYSTATMTGFNGYGAVEVVSVGAG